MEQNTSSGNKAQQISSDRCYSYISGLCEHDVHGLFYLISRFGGCGTSWVSTTNVGNQLGHPTLVDLAKFPGTWKILERSCQDLGKIMVRLFSPCIFSDVCIWYCLIGSLVAMYHHVTHMLTGLVLLES